MRELSEGEYKVFVCDSKITRSIQANRYYWGIVIPLIAGHVGMNKEDLHELLKFKFNKGIVLDPESGEVLEIPKTTTNLKVAEFQSYIEAVKQWATEFLGVIFPEVDELPNEISVLYEP